MNETLTPLSFPTLLRWLKTGERTGNLFGIPRDLFFTPREDDPFRLEVPGATLETPLGVAAGPHTQLAQNIVAAWLCGAREIELKTVQVLDELEIPRPCIDAGDEGYNVEWSQELRLDESFDQYLNAWVLIHLLRRRLGHPGTGPGCRFHLSVGYNLEGIKAPKVQRFLDRTRHCPDELAEKLAQVTGAFPDCADLSVPASFGVAITLSTMHGCPPSEIGAIARHLIEERRLPTIVKLNPTLLGPDELRGILTDSLGFPVEVPDEAFAHDPTFPAAVEMLHGLVARAERAGIPFGVKLTNTLESRNLRRVLTGDVHYLSGRPLHALSTRLAARLAAEFAGRLPISFAGGADAFALPDLLAAGLRPVTLCSDALKPGGYGRLSQYLEELRARMEQRGVRSLEGWTAPDPVDALRRLSEQVRQDPRYRHDPLTRLPFKGERPLPTFDCIVPPCRGACRADQDIPGYLRATAAGDPGAALATVLAANPFPATLGEICDHPCTVRCLRRFYDRAIDIRGVKRFLASVSEPPHPVPAAAPARVAIVGAGPAGLACAFFLRRAGVEVDLFDQATGPGGLAAAVIPRFRLDPSSLRADLDRILATGVRPHWGEPIDESRFATLRATYDFVFVGSGAGASRKLGIPGDDLPGVVGALEFLAANRSDSDTPGRRIAVIGGGNSAIDAARAARRLSGPETRVQLLYRRGRAEMPAEPEEVAAALAEGIELVERVAPLAIGQNPAGGLFLRMAATRAAPRGQDAIIDPDATVLPLQPVDLVIVATGQLRSIPFLPGVVMPKGTGPAWIGERILAGGDARRGPATVASAVGDGRQAAALFLERLSRTPTHAAPPIPGVEIPVELLVRRARRERLPPLPPPVAGPDGLCPPPAALTRAEAEAEAGRCLECDRVCDLCVSVCPNRANLAYESERMSLPRWRLTRRDGRIEPVAAGTLEIAQGRQVFHLAEACNGCGNCDTFCPTAGSPHHDKPTFHLTAGRFATAERGYRWADDATLEGKTPTRETFTLVRTGEGWRLTLPAAEATFDGAFAVTGVVARALWDELDLSFAAEALALHQALGGRFPIPCSD